MAARPVESVKTAGAYFATVTVSEVADAAWLVIEWTTRGYFPAARVVGIWALIWPAAVASRGIATLFNVTQVPPRTVGNGVVEEAAWDARLLPKIPIKLPVATEGW